MDPALLVALGGLGRGISQGAQAYGAAKAGFSPAAERRLRELERMEEMNALGLTGDERENLQRAILDPQRAIQSQRLEQQQALFSDVSAGNHEFRIYCSSNDRAIPLTNYSYTVQAYYQL